MKIKISLIRIDGGTQSRASINEAVVADYAEVLTSGAALPPVTLFFDGVDYWLADGFHRYHAHGKIGALEIDGDVQKGTRRDAVLHSVGANGSHGLQRSNEDKRRAVDTLLADPEWSAWSDRQVAKVCGVSVPFVGAIRRPEVAEKQKIAREPKSIINTPTVDRGVIGLHPEPPAKESPKPVAAPIEEEPEDEGPSAEEIAFLEETEVADRAAYNNLVEIATGDDKLAEALALVVTQTHEIARLKALVRTLEESRDGKMNAINEHIRTIKSLRRKIEKLEKVSA